jgi:predicted Fe-Mo cluster-binding NifX family protein
MENGKLCAHFGHCAYFSIITVENNQIQSIKEEKPPVHEPGVYPRWVASFGVTDVIAGGMGQKAINLFNEQHINAFVGGPIKEAREIVEDFLSGKLTLSANYCNHDENHDHDCKH